jgi:hypothetical protein
MRFCLFYDAHDSNEAGAILSRLFIDAPLGHLRPNTGGEAFFLIGLKVFHKEIRDNPEQLVSYG